MDTDYSNAGYLKICSNMTCYKSSLVVSGEGYRPTVGAKFLAHHFLDTRNPTENEIIMFELIFGEGTVKKIYERLSNKEIRI